MSSQFVTIPCSIGYLGKDTSFALGFISNVGVLLTHTYHHTLMARTSNDGGEDCTGRIIPSKACFAHTRAIVHNQCSNFVVTHFVELKYYHRCSCNVCSTEFPLQLPM